MELPRYEHDCTKCIFLGYEDKYDLYTCLKEDEITIYTVIARYSSEGPDYYSGLLYALEPEKFNEIGRILNIALQRAVNKRYSYK